MQLQQNPLKLGFYWHWSAGLSGEPQLSLNTLPAPDGYVVRPRVLYALNMCASLCPPSLTHRNVLCVALFFWCSLTWEVWQGFTFIQPVVLIDTIKGNMRWFSGLLSIKTSLIFLKNGKIILHSSGCMFRSEWFKSEWRCQEFCSYSFSMSQINVFCFRTKLKQGVNTSRLTGRRIILLCPACGPIMLNLYQVICLS